MKHAAGTIRKFLASPKGEWLLLARALYVVVLCRMALHVIPLSRIRDLATRPSCRTASLAEFPPDRIAWAVQTAARRVPGATCLTQSLALHHLLAKAGHAAEIHIGVAKGERGGLDSHAWVVCHDRVLVGDGGDLGRYQPIVSLGTG